MSSRLGALRHLLAWLSPGPREADAAHPREIDKAPFGDEARDERLEGKDVAPRRSERGNVMELPLREGRSGGNPFPGGTERDAAASPHLARNLMAYLDARAEEALALLLEELSRDTAHELSTAMEETRQTVSAEIEGVRESVLSSNREFSRIGRELVRSGAALESIQTAVSALGPTVERMEDSLRAELAQEHARREQQLREEAERTALDDMLATLDGLETGMEAGRELVRALSDAQHRLKDATVQRWWRAMGEATGTKRPLPEVPLSDVENWIAGLELTHRRLQDALARRGVVPIDAVGKPFDPYIHEAVAVEACPEEQDSLVLREERRGYRTRDRVIRLAQVVVCRAEPARPPGRRRRQSRVLGEQPAGGHEPAMDGDPERTEQREEEQREER